MALVVGGKPGAFPSAPAGVVLQFDGVTASIVLERNGPQLVDVEWSPDGTYALAVSNRKDILRLDPPNPASPQWTIVNLWDDCTHVDIVGCNATSFFGHEVAFNPDGFAWITGSALLEYDGDRLSVIDPGADISWRAIGWSPDGTQALLSALVCADPANLSRDVPCMGNFTLVPGRIIQADIARQRLCEVFTFGRFDVRSTSVEGIEWTFDGRRAFLFGSEASQGTMVTFDATLPSSGTTGGGCPMLAGSFSWLGATKTSGSFHDMTARPSDGVFWIAGGEPAELWRADGGDIGLFAGASAMGVSTNRFRTAAWEPTGQYLLLAGDSGILLAVFVGTLDQPLGLQLVPTGVPGTFGWWRSEVRLTLVPLPGSAALSAEYSIDDQPWRPYGGPVLLAEEGRHVFRFRGIDKTGLTTHPQIIGFNLDWTPPVTTVLAKGARGELDWWRSPVAVTFVGEDGGSGFAHAEASVDGAPWLQRDSIFLNEETSHLVHFRGVDIAGNAETPRLRAYRIDLTAPSLALVSPESRTINVDRQAVDSTATGQLIELVEGRIDGPDAAAWIIGSVNVDSDAEDNGRNPSGLTHYQVSIDSQPRFSSNHPTPWDWSAGVERAGIHEISVSVRDRAGNVAETSLLVRTFPTTVDGVGATMDPVLEELPAVEDTGRKLVEQAGAIADSLPNACSSLGDHACGALRDVLGPICNWTPEACA
jgi:hypothetical protein